MNLKNSNFSTDEPGHAGVPQEFLKHAILDYLVKALTSFPSDCQIEK